MWMNEIKSKQNKTKTKQTKITSYSKWPRVLFSDLATNNAVILLKDDFTAWRKSQEEDVWPMIYY